MATVMAYAEVVVSSSQATSESLPISVLDLTRSRAGKPASSVIARSVELARHVEQLGYKRYWVAEHHSIPGLVCSATPILIGHIAAATKKIRVGSGSHAAKSSTACGSRTVWNFGIHVSRAN